MVGEVLPAIIDQGELATGADSRVDAENRAGSKGGGEKQLPDILGKDPDRRLVGDILQGAVDLGLDAWLDIDPQRQPGRPLQHLTPG